MTTPDRDATFYWRAFATLAGQPTVRAHPGGYVAVDLGSDQDLTVHLHTRAQCDVLIRAATAAKDLLPEGDPS